MSVIVVGAVHGAPGATTLALDLARRCGDDALLIEADPDGGSLAARLDLALKPGLMELAGAARMGIEVGDVWKYAQATSLGVAVVAAHPAAEQTHAALRAAAHHIASAVSRLDVTVVIDVGRLRPGSPALGVAASADHTIIVSDNSVEAIVALTHRAQVISAFGSPLVVLNQSRPYSLAEITTATRQRVWGVVPHASTRRARRSREIGLDGLLHALGSSGVSPEFTQDLAANA
jgi:MinD-like ATPase involved in chromosome partitioning or flagellar assembly